MVKVFSNLIENDLGKTAQPLIVGRVFYIPVDCAICKLRVCQNRKQFVGLS